MFKTFKVIIKDDIKHITTTIPEGGINRIITIKKKAIKVWILIYRKLYKKTNLFTIHNRILYLKFSNSNKDSNLNHSKVQVINNLKLKILLLFKILLIFQTL